MPLGNKAEVAAKFVLGHVNLYHLACGPRSDLIEKIDGFNDTHFVKCSKCGSLLVLKPDEALTRVPIVDTETQQLDLSLHPSS